MPCFADAGHAHRILEQLRDWSAPFGTVIEIENGVGRVHVGRR